MNLNKEIESYKEKDKKDIEKKIKYMYKNEIRI